MADWQSLLPVLKNVFFLQVFLSFCLLLVVFKYPRIIFKIWQRYLVFQTGFTVRKCRVADNFEFEYIERGNKDEQEVSLLLVHGYTSSKDSWCMMAKYVPKRIHVVALDLPGHGGTTRKEKDDISILALAKRVEQFAEAIGLTKKKYHLMGTSLGGFIAGVHAATFPESLLSVMLVCPAGIDAPVKSEMILSYEKEGKIKLLPETDEEFVSMIDMLVYKPVKFPKMIVTGIMHYRRQAREFYLRLLQEITSESQRYLLQERLTDIKTKLMVVWGKHDNALDVSCSEVIKKKLPACRMEILDDCGHSIALERPRKLASILTKFIDE